MKKYFQIILNFEVGTHYEYLEADEASPYFEDTVSNIIKKHVEDCIERNALSIFCPPYKEPRTVRVIEYDRNTRQKRRGGLDIKFKRFYTRLVFRNGKSLERSYYSRTGA